MPELIIEWIELHDATSKHDGLASTTRSECDGSSGFDGHGTIVSMSEIPSKGGYSVQKSPSWSSQSYTEPILTTEVSQTSIESIFAVVRARSPCNSTRIVEVALVTQVPTEGGVEDLVGLEGSINAIKSSDLVGHHSCPTIRELVRDLDKS